MATTSTGSGTVVFSNAGTANGDTFTAAQTGLTEDSTGTMLLDVMANDGGGTKTTLWSLDDGTSALTYATTNNGGSGVSAPTDLLAQDIVGASQTSANGATISITSAGKVSYDASSLTTTFRDALQALTTGQTLSDTFTYAIRMSNGTISWTTATVQFGGINDAPTTPTDSNGTSGGSIAEDAVDGATVGITAQSTDPEGATVTYLLTDNAGGRFAIDSSTGVVTVLDASLLNFEGATSHSITVQASDGSLTSSQSFTIAVTDVNEAPSAPADFSASAAENVGDAATLATVTGTDPDVGGGNDGANNFEDLTYSITAGNGAGLFEIDASTGAISLASGQNLDFEAAQSHVLTVTVTDGGLLSDTVDVTINVTDVNEAPTAPVDFSASAAENVGDAATLATVTGTDPDVGGGNDGANNFEDLTYSITAGNGAGLLEIDASTGAISLASGQNLDFETAQSHVLTVTVTDGGLLSDTVDVTINVTDVNEAPTAPVDFSASAAENVGDAATLATVTGTDPDVGGGNDGANNFEDLTYSITAGNGAGLFEIDASTGAISLASGQSLDFETAQSHVLTVTVTDGGSLSDTVDVTINVTDVNAAPVITSGTTESVNENFGTSAVVHDANATDDGENSGILTYSLTGADAADFIIDSDDGEVRFAASPNFEAAADADTNNVYEITVNAFDGTLTTTKNVSITVNNVNAAPVITSGTTETVAENVLTTVVVHDANATDDGENSGTLTYSLTGADAADFTIDSNDGEVRFVASPNFEAAADADTNNVYEITVNAFDGTLTTTKNVSITVNNVNAAPVITSGTTETVAENVLTTVVVHDANATDDGENSGTLTYSLTGADAADFTIDSNDGEVRFVASPNFEAAADADTNNVYEITVNAFDGTLNTTKNVSITVTDVAEVDPNDNDNDNLGSALPTNLTATGGADILVGTSAGETISALGGADTVYGRGGDDTINGDAQGDTLYGQAGNDTINGGINNDLIYGGSGNDIINGNENNDEIYGGSGNDTINGLDNVDTIFGGSGTDTIDGGINNDIINGGLDNDTITGGTGNDSLAGGGGFDRFVFAAGHSGQSTGNIDIIADLAKGLVGVGDEIDYTASMTIGGSNAGATATQASINSTTGVATFAAGEGMTLVDALADIAARFTAAADSAGEFALFQVNGAGDHYLFISDGVGAVGANDVVVQLTGIAAIGSIDLTGGDLTILT